MEVVQEVGGEERKAECGGGETLPISTNVFSVKLSVLFGKANDVRKDPCAVENTKNKPATSSHHHHVSQNRTRKALYV